MNTNNKTKGSDQFTEIIRQYLRKRCIQDKVFLQRCKLPNKSLDECIQYIFSEVQKSGCNGFADDEIFAMAVHYFDEDDLEIEKGNCARVVVNHHIELTEKEKAEAKRQAIEQYQNKVIAELRQPKTNKAKTETENTLSLF